MPFVKKIPSQDAQLSSTTASSLFVGPTGELLFFVHNILKPEAPTHNILSISGQGGVGKSTLLARFIDEAHSADFKDYCLTALVDERQTTPASMMEKFADQLPIESDFEKSLRQYKEVLHKLQDEREAAREALLRKTTTDIAGTLVKDVPFIGGILQEGVGAATGYLFDELRYRQMLKDAERLEDPIGDLTRAFVSELDRLADTYVPIGSSRAKHRLRVILFFDTFEQLAAEAAPWLLDHFLQAQVSSNVVLVVAGRDPVEHTSPDDPKRWLPYCDGGDIYWISLNSFTEDETRMYLVKRGITDGEQVATIWHMSRGLPLYLGLLTSNPQRAIDPTKDVVVNFLRWIPEREQIKRQLALDAALLSRPFNQDDLEVFSYVPESDRPVFYQWLIEQPFVRGRSQDGRYLYHDVARDLFSRHLYQRSQKHYYEIRRVLATYYQGLLKRIQVEQEKEVYRSEEWLELLLALAFQLFLLPDQASQIKAIEHILNAHEGHTNREQDAAMMRSLRDLAQEPSAYYISPVARWIAMQLFRYIEPDFESQEWLAASEALLEKVAHEPSFPSELLASIYRRRGYAYSSMLEMELALENFQQVLKLLEPTSYKERGWVYWETGNYREAVAHHNHALEQNPQDASAYYGRGFAYTHLGKYQLGIADFDHALELDPNYTEAYNGRGWAYFYAGEYQQAIEAFDHLLKLEPQHTAALRGLGLTYRSLKEYQQALAIFDRYLELDIRNPLIYTDRSECYISLKEYQRSIEDCNRAIELAPKFAGAFSQRGYAHLWLKDPRQAQVDFTRSCELEPTWMGIALMAEWAGMCQETAKPNRVEPWEAIAVVDPQSYTAHACRGIACLLRKRFVEALAELEQALLLDKGRYAAYFWEGMACTFLGRDEEAMEAIEKALALELPPILLAPLRWFEQERPDFYEKYVVPLLAKT